MLTVGFIDWFIQRNKGTEFLKKFQEEITNGKNIETFFEGESDIKGHLLISNHISTLDWAAIKKYVPCSTVTYLGDSSISLEENYETYGTIPYNFLDKDSGKNVKVMIEKLTSENKNVLLFPEGEIIFADKLGKYHKGGFYHAYEKNIPVATFRIDFIDKDGKIITKEHNSWVDVIIYCGLLPIEKSFIKVISLDRFKPSDYSDFDSFMMAIEKSYE